MKKTILILSLITMCSCKNETKKEEYVGPQIIETKEELRLTVLDTLNLSELSKWKLENIRIDSTNQEVRELTFKRAKVDTPAWVMTNVFDILKGSNYRVSIYVKRNLNVNLGLRLTGVFPNRADAVFDLAEGKLIGTSSMGDFENEYATIELIDDNWYKCTLTSEVFSDKLGVLFGPTTDENTISNWLSGTLTENEINIMVDSLLLEEISL
ncbi:MAG: hypothetical protein ACI8RP_000098 [Urechidicola sp.]|jgi:hypothetical protein